MSYIQFRQACRKCNKYWNTSFGIVNTTQIAAPSSKCPFCGSKEIYKIADGWDKEEITND